jgi:hypothetical protein
MATTTNFGWETPDDTDLVKDGAAAIRTALGGVDTSFVDLKGGTTGQILSKASNTDLDYTWITSAGDIEGVTAGTGISGGGTTGTVTITNSMATAIDAKGDLIAGTAADTFSRLAIGSNNQVLTADSAEATGMKWATPTSSTATLTQIATGTLSGTSLSLTGLSSYDQLYLVIYGVNWSGGGTGFDRIRLNNTANNYAGSVWGTWGRATYNGAAVPYGSAQNSFSSIAPNGTVGGVVPNGSYGDSTQLTLALTNCKAAGRTSYDCYQAALDATGTYYWVGGQKGIWNTANTISTIDYTTTSGYTFTGGTYILWGA